ncbi:MAG: LytTR family DNA-binding domain-containing protein [Clostridiales bacterium]|nr:LytTR family DNA-binding domain-containing protein [Clostridiales bacterium]
MRVAVCDDRTETLTELKMILSEIPTVKKIHMYSDMDNLFGMLEVGEQYDVVLLDIDWKRRETGVDFAERLYETCPYTNIIYMTAYMSEYVEDIFLKRANLSGFLTKPVRKEALERNLEKILKHEKETDGKLLVRYQRSSIVIPQKDILYLESQLHKTLITLKHKEYLCNDQLETLKKFLDSSFLNCHKSYVVNMEHIVEFRGHEIVMDDDRCIPVSRARYEQSRECFFSYMSRLL